MGIAETTTDDTEADSQSTADLAEGLLARRRTVRIAGLRGAARAVWVAHLARAHGDRPLLGTDSGKRGYQKAYGAVTGMDFNAAVDGPRMLDEGFDRDYVDQLLCRNGQEFFAFRGRA